MGLSAPVGQVETLASTQERFVFPEGDYEAVLDQVHIGEIPTAEDGTPFAGWVGTEGTVLSLQFGSMSPLGEVDEDAPEIGDRKYFVKITLNDGEISLDDVDINERNVDHWQLQRSARTILNFLMAAGHAEEVDGIVTVADETIELLEEGGLDGSSVGMSIINRKESTQAFKRRLKQDESVERRTFDNLGKFFSL